MQTVIRSQTHRRTFACLLLLVVVSSLFPKHGEAAATSPWLTSEPTFKTLGLIDPSQPLTPDMIGNRDCQPTEIITRPERLLPPQSKQSHDSCIVDTGFGALSASGYLQRQGSDAFGYLRAPAGNQAVVGIPRTNNALATVASSPHGAYVGFYDNLRDLVSTEAFNDTVTHTLPLKPPVMLADQSGNALGIEFSSLSFSSEGEWAVVEAPGVAVLRINTFSHQVLPFADAPIMENSGPAYRTAISSDGDYAVVISKTRGLFKLYDLSTCSSIPTTITNPVNCAATDLMPFINNQVKSYSSVASVRFRGAFTLELYINTSAGIEHALLVAKGHEAAHFEYLSLGDSFASGEGAYQYKALTDTSSNRCHLSLRSYPYLIAKQVQLSQMESVACSGATSDDLINGRGDYRLNSQAAGKEDVSFDGSILDSFLPGYRAQKLFAQRYTPKIITLSVGGNDIGFSDILVRCLGPDTCYPHYEDRLELLNEISAQFNTLAGLYTEIKHSSPESDHIYVIGYPEIADPFGNCAVNVHLNYDELTLANTLVSHLNNVIKAAADHAGVTYLDTQDALIGHRLCETASNHIAVNGLTIGNDILNYPYLHGPLANESYHPNSLGHDLLKSKILALTNNFAVVNKPPKPTAKTVVPDTSSPVLKVPKASRPTRKVIHRKSDNPSPVKKRTKRSAKIKSVGSFFKPGGQPMVVLDSSGNSVGTVTVNPDDSVTVTVTPPDDTTEGPHTVDVIGENSSGEQIDITETIVVGEPTGPCGLFPVSGVDTDQDGIDDACDPLIEVPSSAMSDTNTPSISTGQNSSPPSTVNGSNLQAVPDISVIQPATTSSFNFIPLLLNNRSQTTPAHGSLALSESPGTQTLHVTNQAVKGDHIITGQNSTRVQSPYLAASLYRNPPKLDVVRLRSLFFIILLLCLFCGFVIYKRRKERQ